MRILLINPPNSGRSIPEERYGITSIKQIFRGEPLALETLAGNLTDHQVEILDLKVEPEGLDACLERFNPQLVGFTAMTCEANSVLKLAQQVRNCCSAQIVVGGCHASSDPHFFNREQIDWIVVGLGKQSLAELVAALEAGQTPDIHGIATTTPGQPLRLQQRAYAKSDLVCSRPPAYELVKHYRDEYTLQSLGLKMGLVASAVGCPYDCNFCCISPLTGGRYLGIDTDAVVRDVKLLDRTPVIRLVDANSFGNPKQALQLADALESAGVTKRYLADVRSDTVVRHPEMLKRWKQIGLQAVIIGFEEIEDNALSGMNKDNSAAVNKEAISILHDLGIAIVGDFIIDPDYSEEQFDRLGDFVSEQQIGLPMYTILTPLPSTKLYEQKKDQIVIDDLDYYTLTNAVLPTRLDEELFYQRYAALLAAGHKAAKV